MIESERTAMTAFKDLAPGECALFNIHILICSPTSVLSQVWVSATSWGITTLAENHQATLHYDQLITLRRGPIWAEVVDPDLFENLFRTIWVQAVSHNFAEAIYDLVPESRALHRDYPRVNPVLIKLAYPIVNFPFTLGGNYGEH